jgi:uncharacterized membrane protein YbhN (UPF0104 family)
MKKMVISFFSLLSISIIISFIYPFQPNAFFIQTIYTVSGIMFSVGLGYLVNFSFTGVRKHEFINDVRQNRDKIKKTFITYFLLSSIFYIIDNLLRSKEKIIVLIHVKNTIKQMNLSIFFSIYMLFTIIYYIYNFIQIQVLTDRIFDEVNKELD